MFNPLHDEVLAMILRYLKRYSSSQEIELFTGGVEGDISAPYTPPQDEDGTGGTGGTGGNYEQNIAGLTDGFDYQLLYNDDEDLIGFTSHNGTVTYTLNHDLYEDLISVSVEAERFSFKIALIFENYDMRIDSEEVEDKGKLVEVVLLDVIDNSFELEISPSFSRTEYESEFQFTAIAKYANGSEINVTNEAQWTVTSPSTIENGLVLTAPTYTGTAVITASYDGEVATAELLIEAPIVEPPDDIVISHDHDYKLVLRWEGSINTDMDFRLYSEDARLNVWYGENIYDNGLSQAWLDYDHLLHLDENDRQDKPEIITLKGFVGKTFEVFVSRFSGNPLTQNLTVDLFDDEDNLLEHLDIQPNVFLTENVWVNVLQFKVTESGVETIYRI